MIVRVIVWKAWPAAKLTVPLIAEKVRCRPGPAVGGQVIDREVAGGVAAGDGEGEVRRAAVAFGDGGVADRDPGDLGRVARSTRDVVDADPFVIALGIRGQDADLDPRLPLTSPGRVRSTGVTWASAEPPVVVGG